MEISTNKKLWFELIAVLSIGVLPDLYRAATMIAYPEFLKISYPPGYFSTFLIVRSITVTIPIFYIISLSDKSLANYGISKFRIPQDIFWGILIFIIGLVILTLFTLTLNSLFQTLYDSNDIEAIRKIFSKPKTTFGFLLLIIGCILNGFAEEFVMRGYFIERIKTALNSAFYAIVISALLFASYHLYQRTTGTLSVFVLGLVYGYGYYKLRRVWPLAIAHSIQNIVVFSLMPS